MIEMIYIVFRHATRTATMSIPIVLVVGSQRAREELAQAILQYDELLSSDGPVGGPGGGGGSGVQLGSHPKAFRSYHHHHHHCRQRRVSLGPA